MRHSVLVAFLLCGCVNAFAGEPAQRTLSFEDRVKAQEAIERVYYSHQIGATKQFEQAVPRAVLESKVRKYLEETAGLQLYWKTAVTGEMLQRELERMAQGTRMPERLSELFHALGDDSVLIEETLARPALVDRIARECFASDSRIHAARRVEAERLRARLLGGALGKGSSVPNRFVQTIRIAGRTGGAPKFPRVTELELEPTEFAAMRAGAPRRVGEVGPLTDRPEAFTFQIVLSEDSRSVRIATYVIPKVRWDDWWAGARKSLSPSSTATVAGVRPLPSLAAALTNSNWSPTSTDNAPLPRETPAAVWTGSLMIVWGGDSRFPLFNDTGGRYDPATDTWTPTSRTNVPAARALPAYVWTGSVMIVWGGFTTDDTPLNTGGRYDPITDTWTATPTVGAPSARIAHTAIWTGSAMVVWGGSDFTNNVNTGGRYDPATNTWAAISTSNAPSARIWPGAVWTGSEMIVWGGHDGSASNSGGRYDPGTDVWTPVSATNAPSGRYYFSTIWTGSEMIVWGGYNGAALRTGGRYDPATDAWTATSMTSAPSARWWHSAVWTGSVMVVWGGLDYVPPNTVQVDTGAIYDPLTGIWAPTSTVDAPSARSYHRAVWTGSVMVVWGGWSGGYGSYFQTGGLYVPEASPDPADNDGDGFREIDGDCDDGNAANYPGATELCDGVANDCGDPAWPAVPASEADADGDGFRICQGDCDDTKSAIYPGAPELCDGWNFNCSDPAWPATPASELDADRDTFRICAGDCDDTSPFVRPGAPQQCDGLNNDCNDPSWPAIPAAELDSDGDGYPQCGSACEVQVSAARSIGGPPQLLATGPNMVASGNGFALCFRVSNAHDNYYRAARLDSWGRKIGPDVDVRGYILSTGPHVCVAASAGANMGVAFTEYNTVGFAAFDASMSRTAATTPAYSTELVETPALIWTGQEYGLVWKDWRDWEFGKPEIYFARVGSDGERIGLETRVSEAFGTSEFPAVAWSGSEYGIAWQDNRDGQTEIYFARVDAAGERVGPEQRFTTHAPGEGVATRPVLAGNGNGYGLTWLDGRNGPTELYFVALDASGNKLGPDVRMTFTGVATTPPVLTATGSGYFLAWSAGGSRYMLIDASGVPTTAPQLFTGGQSIVWTGTDTAAAYSATRAPGVFDIFFTRGHCNDCAATDASVYPGAPQLCDGRNNNCSDPVWPAPTANDVDADGDGLTTCAGDCNDDSALAFPGAPEICDAIDDNCNGLIDEDTLGVDTDADSIHNACDNCRTVFNADQIDSDGDHIGNSCDNCLFVANDTQVDIDGDGRGNACDNCARSYNPAQDDLDVDNAGDACDNCVFDYNPSQSDGNHDGEGDLCDFNDGLIYIYSTDKNYREWQQESGYVTWNGYRGSLAVLRATGQYTQAPGSNPLAGRDCGLTDPYVFDILAPAPGEVAFNLVTGVAGGVESGLGTNSAGAPRPNGNPCP